MKTDELNLHLAKLLDPDTGADAAESAATAIRDAFAALTPPTPEDVTRMEEEVQRALVVGAGEKARKTAWDALARLRDAAARAVESEAAYERAKKGATPWMAELHAAKIRAESERDAARQEVERLKEDTKEAEAAAHSSETIASDALKENERLTARVAELEREKESAERRMQELEAVFAAAGVDPDVVLREDDEESEPRTDVVSRVRWLVEDRERVKKQRAGLLAGDTSAIACDCRRPARYGTHPRADCKACGGSGYLLHRVGHPHGPKPTSGPAGLLEAVLQDDRVEALRKYVQDGGRLLMEDLLQIMDSHDALSRFAACDAAKGGADVHHADLRRVLEMARGGSHVGDTATPLGEETVQAVRAAHEKAAKWDAAVRKAQDVDALAMEASGTCVEVFDALTDRERADWRTVGSKVTTYLGLPPVDDGHAGKRRVAETQRWEILTRLKKYPPTKADDGQGTVVLDWQHGDKRKSYALTTEQMHWLLGAFGLDAPTGPDGGERKTCGMARHVTHDVGPDHRVTEPCSFSDGHGGRHSWEPRPSGPGGGEWRRPSDHAEGCGALEDNTEGQSGPCTCEPSATPTSEYEPGGEERVPPVPLTPDAKAKAMEAIASLRARMETHRAVTNATPEPTVSVAAKRTCNLHKDCAAAEELAKAEGTPERFGPGSTRLHHCSDDDCEDCYGK